MRAFLAPFLLALMFLVLPSGAAESETAIIRRVVALNIGSTINPATLDYLDKGLARAKQQGETLVLVRMNTPGGLISTTKSILALMGGSSVPVAVWIGPEGASATSAGAIIASGAHFLYMAPGSNIGAATPVDSGGDIASKDLRSKAINDLKAQVRSLAQEHGRNPEAYGKMIDQAASFDAREAVKLKIVDGLAASEAEVLSSLQGRTWNTSGKSFKLDLQSPVVEGQEMGLGQKILDVLGHPQVAYILFLIGAALLYFELQAPGGYISGSIGVGCLLMAGIGLQVLPLNFGAMALLVLAFVLFILEIYVTSFGLLSLAGLASMAAGSLFLFNGPDSYLTLGLPVIISACAGVAIFLALVAWFWVREEKARKRQPAPAFNRMVGREAVVAGVLPGHTEALYQVQVAGETWKARACDGKGPFEKGQIVKVVAQVPEELILVIE